MKILIITRSDVERMPGFRYARAFSSLGHEVYIDDFRTNRSSINIQGLDFVLYDDNADYDIYPKYENIPCYYLAIDTGVEGGFRCKRQGQFCDHIFYAQKRDHNLFNDKTNTWLPHAFDSIISPESKFISDFFSRPIDISIVGDFDSRIDRQNIKSLLLKTPYRVHITNNASMLEMANIYSSSKIVVNHNTYLDTFKYKDINLRMFESTGYGALTFVHEDTKLNGLEDLEFMEYMHYIPYSNDNDIIKKLDKYLINDKFISCSIARRGQELVCNKHTYIHRCQEILKVHRTLLG